MGDGSPALPMDTSLGALPGLQSGGQNLNHVESIQKLDDQNALHIESQGALPELQKNQSQLVFGGKSNMLQGSAAFITIKDSHPGLGLFSPTKSDAVYFQDDEHEKPKNELNFAFQDVTKFDKKILKMLMSEEYLNENSVRTAITSNKKPLKPFFNHQRAVSSVLSSTPKAAQSQTGTLPGSWGKPSLSPKSSLFKSILEEGKQFKTYVDTTKTIEEERAQIRLEKSIKDDDLNGKDIRQEFTKKQLKEYAKKVESRKTKYQERRNSVSKVHLIDPPHSDFKLPEIMQVPDKNPFVMSHMIPATKRKLGKMESKVVGIIQSQIKEKVNQKVAKMMGIKNGGPRDPDARPISNKYDGERSPDPRKYYDEIKPLTDDKIEQISYKQEEWNKSNELSKLLDMHTSPDRAQVKELSRNWHADLKERKQTLSVLKDPTFIPENKYLDGSRILKLAYLDKIVEQCEIGDIKNSPKYYTKSIYDFC